MYDVIQLTDPHKSMFSLDNLITESTCDQLYTEAVFSAGKEKLKPLVDTLTKIQELLLSEIKPDEKSPGKEFNPHAFWKNTLWKKFEDQIKIIFGFRNVSVNPYIEKYSKESDEFESHELNACIYRTPRYPITGLITDKGFYDVSKSVDMEIYISLGMIKDLTPEELVAVFLHEFGHSIDPALTDIKYIGTNIMVKYITDRKKDITKEETKVIKENRSKILSLIINIGNSIGNFFEGIRDWFKFKFKGKEKYQDEKLEKIQQALKEDKDEFKRQEFSEAFADNFARMYGYGPQLMSAIKKLSKNEEKQMHSWVAKEHKRELAIFMMTQDALKDVHKTEVHRVKALIKEYKDDIADKNTPKEVKKALEEDVKSLEMILDSYTKDFSEFQNRVNKLIIEELDIKGSESDNEVITEAGNMMRKSKHYVRKNKNKSKSDDISKFRAERKQTKFMATKPSELGLSKEEIKDKVGNVLEMINDETETRYINLILGSPIKDDNKRTTTKIGGTPYWPKDQEWPSIKSSYSDKKYVMICLAQINCSEIPHLDGFPTSGILQFFAYDWESGHRVIYHEKIDEKNMLDEVPRVTTNPDSPNAPADGFEKIDMRNIVYYPKAFMDRGSISFSYDKFETLSLKYVNKEFGKNYTRFGDIPWEILDELYRYAERGDGCKIGGYAHFIQGEPDWIAPSRKEFLLLQIDSYGEIELGDGGSLQFFCSMDALKNKDFAGKTYFDIACS